MFCFFFFFILANTHILAINLVWSADCNLICCSEGEKIKRQIETSPQKGRKKRAGKYTAVSPWRRGRLKKKKKQQLWRNNFLAIHQWAHVDPIDKLLITKSIAMNFHCCQTEGVPGEWSPRDFVLTFRTPSSSSPLIDPHLSPLPHNTSLPELCCLKKKAHHQHFHFSATHKTRESSPVTQACIDQSATGPASSKGACQ